MGPAFLVGFSGRWTVGGHTNESLNLVGWRAGLIELRENHGWGLVEQQNRTLLGWTIQALGIHAAQVQDPLPWKLAFYTH